MIPQLVNTPDWMNWALMGAGPLAGLVEGSRRLELVRLRNAPLIAWLRHSSSPTVSAGRCSSGWRLRPRPSMGCTGSARGSASVSRNAPWWPRAPRRESDCEHETRRASAGP